MGHIGRVLVDCGDLGRRVTVRSRLASGGTTDVVGILEGCDEDRFVVRDRRGAIRTIDRSEVVAARVVPAAPERPR